MFLHGTKRRDDERHRVHNSVGAPSAETHGNCDLESQQSAAVCQMGRMPLQRPDDQWHELQSEQSVQRRPSLLEPSPDKQHSIYVTC